MDTNLGIQQLTESCNLKRLHGDHWMNQFRLTQTYWLYSEFGQTVY